MSRLQHYWPRLQVYCQDYCKSCPVLVPVPNLCATDPYGLLETLSDSEEALELNNPLIHREAPHLRYMSIPGC